MATVAEAITRCRRTVNMGADIALLFLQEALDEMAVNLPVNLTTEDLPAVASQREYSLSVLCRRIWMVEWVTGSADTERSRLKPTSVARLNSSEPNWRRRSPGKPTRRYSGLSSDSRVVGVDPAPIDAASGGYPLIRVHESRTMTLTAVGNLPASLLSIEAIVLGACLKYAVENDSKRISSLESAANKALQREIEASAAIGFFDVEDPPDFQATWICVPGVG